MSQATKFRYVSELAGGFVLLVLILLVASIIVAGQAQKWFEPVYRVQVLFPPEGTFGLQKGGEVDILQTKVGEVEEISVDDDGKMTAVFKIRGPFIRFIRTDSVAIVKRKFGVAGDAFVEITVGQGPQAPLKDGGDFVMEVKKDTELIELAQSLVEQVQDAIVPAIDEFKLALQEYRALASDLRAPTNDLQRSFAHVERITAGLEKGEGTLGRLLRDPTAATEIERILKSFAETGDRLNRAATTIEKIVKDINSVSGTFPEMSATIRGELKDLPGLVLQAQSTMNEAEKLLAGLQKHWLLRAYMEKSRPLEAIPLQSIDAPTGVTP